MSAFLERRVRRATTWGPYRFTRQLEKEEALPRSTDNHVCRPNATCPYSALLTSRMRGAEGSIRLRYAAR